MEYSNKYTIAVLGDAETGKSTICELMRKNNDNVNLIKTIKNYQGINGVFIVVDLLQITTFRGAIEWKNDLYEKYLRDLEYDADETIPIILLINKADKFVRYLENNVMTANLYNDEISYTDCEDFCGKYQFTCHFYVSNKNHQSGMKHAYEKMIELCGKVIFPTHHYIDHTKYIKIDLLLNDYDNKIPNLIDICTEQNSDELICMFKKSTILDVENLVTLMADMTKKPKLICLKKLEEQNGDVVLAISALL